jgi:hypothetical protein
MPDLERRLRELGDELAWPQTPDIAAAVAARLPAYARAGGAGLRGAHRGWSRRRRLVAVLVAALLLLPAAALAIPGPRHAILDALGLRHVAVQRVQHLPPAHDPRLGELVALSAVPRTAGFTPLAPTALPAPDRAYVLQRIVTYVYDRPHLLLAQARGRLDADVILQKVLSIEKTARRVTVGDAAGLWLPSPHAYMWADATGPLVRSGSALVWERGDLVLRLEGARSLREALAVARSVP